MAGPAFETGFTKIEAPKLKDYGAALNPIADNFKRLSDIENKKEELAEKRAFQVSREKTLNQWQKDAEALKVTTNATAAKKLGEVQKSIHRLDNTSKESIANGQNETSITNNKLTNRTNKENSILTNKTSRGNSIRSTNASVTVGKGHDTARVESSRLAKQSSDYRVDHLKGGKSYVDTDSKGNSVFLGSNISLPVSYTQNPKSRYLTEKEFTEQDPEQKALSDQIVTNIHAFSENFKNTAKSLSLKLSNMIENGNIKGFLAEIKKEDYITEEQDKEIGRNVNTGSPFDDLVQRQTRTKIEKDKINIGRIVKEAKRLQADMNGLHKRYVNKKGQVPDGYTNVAHVDIKKALSDNVERRKRADSLYSKKKLTKKENTELKKLRADIKQTFKLINLERKNEIHSQTVKLDASAALSSTKEEKRAAARENKYNSILAAMNSKNGKVSETEKVWFSDYEKELGI